MPTPNQRRAFFLPFFFHPPPKHGLPYCKGLRDSLSVQPSQEYVLPENTLQSLTLLSRPSRQTPSPTVCLFNTTFPFSRSPPGGFEALYKVVTLFSRRLTDRSDFVESPPPSFRSSSFTPRRKKLCFGEPPDRPWQAVLNHFGHQEDSPSRRKVCLAFLFPPGLAQKSPGVELGLCVSSKVHTIFSAVGVTGCHSRQPRPGPTYILVCHFQRAALPLRPATPLHPMLRSSKIVSVECRPHMV